MLHKQDAQHANYTATSSRPEAADGKKEKYDIQGYCYIYIPAQFTMHYIYIYILVLQLLSNNSYCK